MTLRGDETHDLTHPDRLQRELALAFARALHSHTCSACGMLRVCTVVACEFRPDDRRLIKALTGNILPVVTERYVCCECQLAAASNAKGRGIESAGDEVGGGDDEA